MTTRLDRIVELQSRTVTRDSYGGEIVSWSEIDKVWANVNQTGVSENFENESNRDIALRNSTIRIRWRDDVRESGRVVYDGFPWDIKGIAELGYRRELELFCQTDVHRPETAFTPVTDAGRILWGANTLVTWGGDTEIICEIYGWAANWAGSKSTWGSAGVRAGPAALGWLMAMPMAEPISPPLQP